METAAVSPTGDSSLKEALWELLGKGVHAIGLRQVYPQRAGNHDVRVVRNHVFRGVD